MTSLQIQLTNMWNLRWSPWDSFAAWLHNIQFSFNFWKMQPKTTVQLICLGYWPVWIKLSNRQYVSVNLWVTALNSAHTQISVHMLVDGISCSDSICQMKCVRMLLMMNPMICSLACGEVRNIKTLIRPQPHSDSLASQFAKAIGQKSALLNEARLWTQDAC